MSLGDEGCKLYRIDVSRARDCGEMTDEWLNTGCSYDTLTLSSSVSRPNRKNYQRIGMLQVTRLCRSPQAGFPSRAPFV